jgi:hypothetical protein
MVRAGAVFAAMEERKIGPAPRCRGGEGGAAPMGDPASAPWRRRGSAGRMLLGLVASKLAYFTRECSNAASEKREKGRAGIGTRQSSERQNHATYEQQQPTEN